MNKELVQMSFILNKLLFVNLFHNNIDFAIEIQNKYILDEEKNNIKWLKNEVCQLYRLSPELNYENSIEGEFEFLHLHASIRVPQQFDNIILKNIIIPIDKILSISIINNDSNILNNFISIISKNYFINQEIIVKILDNIIETNSTCNVYLHVIKYLFEINNDNKDKLGINFNHNNVIVYNIDEDVFFKYARFEKFKKYEKVSFFKNYIIFEKIIEQKNLYLAMNIDNISEIFINDIPISKNPLYKEENVEMEDLLFYLKNFKKLK